MSYIHEGVLPGKTGSLEGSDHLGDLAALGFFVAEPFLPACKINSLVDAVEALETDQQASRFRKGITFARRNLLECGFVTDLISEPKVRELLAAIAPSLIAVRAILFDKVDSANWTVPWHQDRSIAVSERLEVPGFGPWSIKAGVVHVQPPVEILRQMLTLRLHLDACPAENGPLRVISATHDRILDQEEVEAAVALCEQTICTIDAGGLLVMRPLLLHASSPAVTPSHRRVIHIEFGPPLLPGGLAWAARQSD